MDRTAARAAAKQLGYLYVDTGAMYRGLAVHFLKKGIRPEDTEKIKEACRDAQVSIGYEEGQQQVYLNGENITPLLRSEEVGEKLLSLQREMARSQNVVMDGRDIGTCVLPDADVKVYLTASSRTRAKRRYDELTSRGVPCDLEQIERDIIERDSRDMNRETAPLRQAEDAVLVDSSDMTIRQVADTILGLCR